MVLSGALHLPWRSSHYLVGLNMISGRRWRLQLSTWCCHWKGIQTTYQINTVDASTWMSITNSISNSLYDRLKTSDRSTHKEVCNVFVWTLSPNIRMRWRQGPAISSCLYTHSIVLATTILFANATDIAFDSLPTESQQTIKRTKQGISSEISTTGVNQQMWLFGS